MWKRARPFYWSSAKELNYLPRAHFLGLPIPLVSGRTLSPKPTAGKPWPGFSGFVKERIKLLRRACGNIFQTSYEEDRVSITPRSLNSPPSALITLYQIHRICQPPIIISKRSTSFLCIQRGGFGILDNRHAPKDQGLLLVGVL